MARKIVIASIIAIALAWLSYWYNFSYLNSYRVSNDPGDWGVLGDFLGGVLNPILTFFTIVLLVSSLRLQRDSNENLKIEIERGERFEKVRSFESRFFNMIDSQKVLFDRFKLDFPHKGGIDSKTSSAAVNELEDLIIEIKRAGGSDIQIKDTLERFDDNSEIYSVTRTFCIIAKSINERISITQGFTRKEQEDFYEVLINFTDYSLFRLILICLKYLSYKNLDILKEETFQGVLKKLGATDYLESI